MLLLSLLAGAGKDQAEEQHARSILQASFQLLALLEKSQYKVNAEGKRTSSRAKAYSTAGVIAQM